MVVWYFSVGAMAEDICSCHPNLVKHVENREKEQESQRNLAILFTCGGLWLLKGLHRFMWGFMVTLRGSIDV